MGARLRLHELRAALDSKIANANSLVARVRALAADYGMLDEELRKTEDELAARVVELALASIGRAVGWALQLSIVEH